MTSSPHPGPILKTAVIRNPMAIKPRVRTDSYDCYSKDQNVLVTGGAGFIGSHLVDALVGANDVTFLDNFSTGYRDNVNPEATVIEGDIRDRDIVEYAMDGMT